MKSSRFLLMLLCWVSCFGQDLKLQTTVVNLEFTVLDRQGNNLTQFNKTDFALYENKVKQEIGYFEKVDEPVSYSFVVDMSGSMGSEFGGLKKSVQSFVQFAHPADTYNLIMFNEKFSIAANLSGDDFLSRFLFVKPKRRTALWDAVNAGIDAVQASPNKRKALILFSDGMDNFSRLSAGKVIQRIKESNIHTEVFAFQGAPVSGFVQAADPIRLQVELELLQRDATQASQNLQDFAAISGSSVIPVQPSTDLDFEAARLAVEMRRAFTLGYVSTAEPDGKWRKIEVKIPGCSFCKVQVRPGYFARESK